MAKLNDIEKMTIKEVIDKYDYEADHCNGGISFWLEVYNNKKNELLVEEQRKLNKQMLLYTKAMTFMTIIVVITTIVSLILALR